MNIHDWDKQIEKTGREIQRARRNLLPSQNSGQYLTDLENAVSALENELGRLGHCLEEKSSRKTSTRANGRALIYWTGHLIASIRRLSNQTSRLGTKELWLKLFKVRSLGAELNENDSHEEVFRIVSECRKMKETESFLSSKLQILTREEQAFARQSSSQETKKLNAAACSGMQISTEFSNPGEWKALEILSKLFNYVEFRSHIPQREMNKIKAELQNIRCKSSKLLDKCRELALDSLDFDRPSELHASRQRFSEYLDTVHILEARLAKITDSITRPRAKVLHPVLIKSEKPAKTTSKRFRSRNPEDLL